MVNLSLEPLSKQVDKPKATTPKLSMSDPKVKKAMSTDHLLEKYKNKYPNKRPVWTDGETGEEQYSKHFENWKEKAIKKIKSMISEESTEKQPKPSSEKPKPSNDPEAPLMSEDPHEVEVNDLKIRMALQKKLNKNGSEIDVEAIKLKKAHDGLISKRGAYVLIAKARGINLRSLDELKGIDLDFAEFEIREAKKLKAKKEDPQREVDPIASKEPKDLNKFINLLLKELDSIDKDKLKESFLYGVYSTAFLFDFMNKNMEYKKGFEPNEEQEKIIMFIYDTVKNMITEGT